MRSYSFYCVDLLPILGLTLYFANTPRMTSRGLKTASACFDSLETVVVVH